MAHQLKTEFKNEEKFMRRMVKLGSLAVLVMAASLTGCGGLLERDKAPTEDEILLGQEGRTMWESKLQYVKIVTRDLPGVNEHPESLTSDQVRTILGSLYVSEGGLISKSENPVFSPGELQILGPSLANGLAQAGTDEDINFVTIGQHKGTISREEKTTTGRVFISDGRLNIVFGLLHELYREKDPVTNQPIDRRINPLLPGTRKSEADFSGNIVLDKGQSFYLDPETGKERRDWLVIDIATVLKAAADRKTGNDGLVSPELLEDVARSKQETGNLREDVGSMKEIIFDMSDEIERLKKEIEELKSKQ
jgi:hypothetical protein